MSNLTASAMMGTGVLGQILSSELQPLVVNEHDWLIKLLISAF